jgi:HEPN domain-containing protein
VTTVVAALRSIELGEPEALRKASQALALALAALMAAMPGRARGTR